MSVKQRKHRKEHLDDVYLHEYRCAKMKSKCRGTDCTVNKV